MKRDAFEICSRIFELDKKGEEVVSINMEDAVTLANHIGQLNQMVIKANKEKERQKQLAEAIYADAMLQQEKFTVLERV